jgi:PAS domain-containing protein
MEGEEVPSQYEVKLQRKDGSSFDGEINARKIMFGNDPGIQVWVRDITERKLAEEALRRSEEKYRLLVDNANDGVFIAQDGRIKFPNPKVMQILGYTADELTGIHYLDLVHPDDRSIVHHAEEKLASSSETASVFHKDHDQSG